jgi:hypothetical protein
MRLYTKKHIETVHWLDFEAAKLDSMIVHAEDSGGVDTAIKVKMYQKFLDDVLREKDSIGVEVPDTEAKEFLLKYVKRDERGLHDAW